ncbi:MAG TPA: type I restriction-modification system subunit M N-terminal domain-containing protein [Methylomirabilota bacterium]|nr:type I restriction-modification system subunit M N-terminal domain-containing protein [Methylomirabilota bacterium]
MAKVKSSASKSNGSALGFEAQLWAAADKMRGHMDASEYKHVCLGLIFAETVKFHASQLANEWILAVTGDAVTKWAERIEFLLTGREGAFARATALREELAGKLDWQRAAGELLQKLAISKT